MKHFIYWILFAVTAFLPAACSDDPVVQQPIGEEGQPGTDGSADDESVTLARLHVDDRYLVDAEGNKVNLHGFVQTFSPFFNDNQWSDYNVEACLEYNQGMIDKILEAGWKVNLIRQHMDPYWSSPGNPHENEAHLYYDEVKFKKYLDEVFVPMAEYAIRKGFYIIMRPPGVCPEVIEKDGDYYNYLFRIWEIVSQHDKLKNNPYVMFELANEPIKIKYEGGQGNGMSDADFKALKEFFQPIVDKIRENADNILWVPGLCWQQHYQYFPNHPIDGGEAGNIGYAVHCYPGWYGSDGSSQDITGTGGYEGFQEGWDTYVGPAAEFAPIVVTEIDWADKSVYPYTFGDGITGTAGAEGFGANFKRITDFEGNVSWTLFADQKYMAQFKNEPGIEGQYTFFNDPQACLWPTYHWFEEYAAGTPAAEATVDRIVVSTDPALEGGLTLQLDDVNATAQLKVEAVYTNTQREDVTAQATFTYTTEGIVNISNDGTITATASGTTNVTVTYGTHATTFVVVVGGAAGPSGPVLDYTFDFNDFKTNLSGSGASWDYETLTLSNPGEWGVNGWQFDQGFDITHWKYVVAELTEIPDNAINLAIICRRTSEWGMLADAYGKSHKQAFSGKKIVYIGLENGLMSNAYGEDPVEMDLKDVGIIGIQNNSTTSGLTVKLKRVYLTNELPEGATE